MKKRALNQKGFGLVEVVVVLAIIASSFLFILGFFLFSRSATIKAEHNDQAVSLNEQAMETVRKLRDDGWSNISSLTTGTNYYLQLSGGNKWILTTTNPSPSSYYTTKVVLSAVNRDANDNISAAGTNDPNTRQIVVTTTWSENGTQTVNLTTYITNFNNT